MTFNKLRDRGVYKLRGTMYVARVNDDRPEPGDDDRDGDYLFALYKYADGKLEDVPHLFIESDGETLFSTLARDIRDGVSVSELTDTGLNSLA